MTRRKSKKLVKKIVKSFPRGKIRNPKTGRFVKKSGVIGKKILARRKSVKRRKSSRRSRPRKRKSRRRSKKTGLSPKLDSIIDIPIFGIDFLKNMDTKTLLKLCKTNTQYHNMCFAKDGENLNEFQKYISDRVAEAVEVEETKKLWESIEDLGYDVDEIAGNYLNETIHLTDEEELQIKNEHDLSTKKEELKKLFDELKFKHDEIPSYYRPSWYKEMRKELDKMGGPEGVKMSEKLNELEKLEKTVVSHKMKKTMNKYIEELQKRGKLEEFVDKYLLKEDGIQEHWKKFLFS